ADFHPEVTWVPPTAWGAPPAGWPMWVDSENGSAANPPEEYRSNPYLFISVMPGIPVQVGEVSASASGQSDGAGTGSQSAAFSSSLPRSEVPQGKKPMGKGLKITLWTAGIITALAVLGSCGGGDKEAVVPPSPSATDSQAPAQATASEALAAETQDAAAEAAASESAAAESEASMKAEKEASASAEAEE